MLRRLRRCQPTLFCTHYDRSLRCCSMNGVGLAIYDASLVDPAQNYIQILWVESSLRGSRILWFICTSLLHLTSAQSCSYTCISPCLIFAMICTECRRVEENEISNSRVTGIVSLVCRTESRALRSRRMRASENETTTTAEDSILSIASVM